jgi:hypothetical protein
MFSLVPPRYDLRHYERVRNGKKVPVPGGSAKLASETDSKLVIRNRLKKEAVVGSEKHVANYPLPGEEALLSFLLIVYP